MMQRLLCLAFFGLAALVAPGAHAQWSQTDFEVPGYSSPTDFGDAVAIAGNWALVGDYATNGSSGRVSVYQRASNNTWSLSTTLSHPSGSSGTWFGRSVDLWVSGSTCRAIVGAPRELNRGAAYLYTCGSWGSPTRVEALNPGSGDSFGESVAISGGRALVGAFGETVGGAANAGAVHVYELISGSWTQVQRFTASSPSGGAFFGQSVALDGARAAIGSPFYRLGSMSQAGAVYVFDRSGSTFTQTAMLTAGDAGAGDRLGWSIDLALDVVVAGAISEDAQASNSGALYVFSRDHLGAWAQRAKLKAPDAASGDQLGVRVATILNGMWIAAGSPSRDDQGTSSGAVYIFRRSGCSSWAFEDKVLAGNGGVSHLFGADVGLESRGVNKTSSILTLLSGAPGGGTSSQGAAYWLERSIPSYYYATCRPR